MSKMVKAMALCALASAMSGAFAQSAKPSQAQPTEAVFIVGGEVREGAPAKAERLGGADGPAIVQGPPNAALGNPGKDDSKQQAPAPMSKPAAKQIGDKAPKELVSKLSVLYAEHLAHMDVEMEAKMECVDSAKVVQEKPLSDAQKAELAAKGQGDTARFKSQLECLAVFKSKLPGRVQSQELAKWLDADAFKAAYEVGLATPIGANLALQRMALKIAAYWQIASLEASHAAGMEQASAMLPSLEAGVWAGIERNRGELGAVKAFAGSTADREELEVAESMAENIGSESFQALQALYVAKNVAVADAASRSAEKGDKKPLENFGAKFDAWMGEMVSTRLKP